MRNIAILFSLLGPLVLAAQDAETASPKLKGVLLVDDSSKLQSADLAQVEGIRFEGVEEGSLKTELAPFLADLEVTAEGVKQLCNAVSDHYKNEGLRVAVSAPESTSAEGVVSIVVSPEKLGEVNVKTGQFTKAETLKKWVRLASNDTINEKTIAQDVAWMNTNPFRSVKVEYKDGEKPGVTNVDLVVSDKKNWKVISGVDNTGTQPIGPLRIFAGLSVNDFIFTDHTLNIQATTADHYSEYQSITVQYAAPLPWRNLVKVFGSYASTTPERSPFPQKHRESYQASTRYVIPQWFSMNPWVDQISYETGFDFKGTNTNVFFESDAAPTANILSYISQFVAGVNAQRVRATNKVSAGIDFVGSPLRMLPNQTDKDFDNLRAGATPIYLYSRLSLAVDQKLPLGMKLAFQGRSQFSVSNLVPSEQFSLGGYSTVRGYDERIVSGDNAVCANLELKAPEFSPVGMWFPKVGDSLTFLGFVDAGYAWFREALPNTPVDQSLVGVGAGVRYAVSSYFTSRLDLGVPMLKVEKDSGKPHVHFNAVLSY